MTLMRQLRGPQRLRRPRCSDPPADDTIVRAAADLRAAGYFARLSDLSDEDVGKALKKRVATADTR